MKTFTPVKTAALATLAASLVLPVAQANPTTPVKRASAPVRANTWAREALLRDFNAYKKATALPRQVQLKFEWITSTSAVGAAPDKSMDALTIIAEEGRKAQVSSRHLQNGAGGEETISVLPHFEPGGVVALDITERSDSTARAGDTKSNSAETTVRVKTGETGTVRVQVSKEGGQGAERILFVTPTIVEAGGG